MRTSEAAKLLEEWVLQLRELFLERNAQYAGEEVWDSNFVQAAKTAELFRIKEMIEKPYGQTIRYVLEKINRAINGILNKNQAKMTHIEDSIDDAVVYLLITKLLLVEAGIIEGKKDQDRES